MVMEWGIYMIIETKTTMKKVFYRTLFIRKENKRIGGKS